MVKTIKIDFSRKVPYEYGNLHALYTFQNTRGEVSQDYLKCRTNVKRALKNYQNVHYPTHLKIKDFVNKKCKKYIYINVHVDDMYSKDLLKIYMNKYLSDEKINIITRKTKYKFVCKSTDVENLHRKYTFAIRIDKDKYASFQTYYFKIQDLLYLLRTPSKNIISYSKINEYLNFDI